MIVVTGAAGFIGSCIVGRLNERGQTGLWLVDCLDDDAKKANLAKKKYARYSDKSEFIKIIQDDKIKEPIEAILHMGACSSTTLQDAAHFQENNFEYTLKLAEWALKHPCRFVYASSAATYGDGSVGYKDDNATTRRCKPLNFMENPSKSSISGRWTMAGTRKWRV